MPSWFFKRPPPSQIGCCNRVFGPRLEPRGYLPANGAMAVEDLPITVGDFTDESC